MKKVGLVVAYVALYVWTWGAFNADIQDRRDCSRYRGDLAVTAGICLLPPMLVVIPFITGFYEHGWRLTRSPACAGNTFSQGVRLNAAAGKD